MCEGYLSPNSLFIRKEANVWKLYRIFNSEITMRLDSRRDAFRM